ncbi:hypothetical protein BBBOND_0201010 [Babesia bigemina]|uniref:Ig-like domain-containing protein n=1 Tax=Babesia bigemina TaxID=5866 RepID=A0A061D7R5_BABBI|nr:hypothetical protein BBBOND_0201010 [Babesia bigemina]CDR94944.1 hypothetical protein BBBOND_0201010 [Babesia bigemina]|eukprot:XP_012767130.1 hypothetical protein BBBOND_0201010 [Babesia bigemina]
MRPSSTSSGTGRMYQVLFGQQSHLYYLCLSVNPYRSIAVLDHNLRPIRRIDVKDVLSFQRRVLSNDPSHHSGSVTHSDVSLCRHCLQLVQVFELQLSSDKGGWLRFGLPTTEECDQLCSSVQLHFGVPVYNYGSLSTNFRASLGPKAAACSNTVDKGPNSVCKSYRLVRDDFYASAAGDFLTQLGITCGDNDQGLGDPPAEFSTDYPVIMEGPLEAASYVSFRSMRKPQMHPFSVYRAEWYLSTHRGDPGEFYPAASCSNDIFYLNDWTIGRYVQLRVYKAVGTGVNRKFVFTTATRGPVRFSNVLAHNILLNVSKDNEAHNVLICAKQFRAIAAHLKKLPFAPTGGTDNFDRRLSTKLSLMQIKSSARSLHLPGDSVEELSGENVDNKGIRDSVTASMETAIQPAVTYESTGSFGSYADDNSDFLGELEGNAGTATPRSGAPRPTEDPELFHTKSLLSADSATVLCDSDGARDSAASASRDASDAAQPGAEVGVTLATWHQPVTQETGKAEDRPAKKQQPATADSAPTAPKAKPPPKVAKATPPPKAAAGGAAKPPPEAPRMGRVRGFFKNIFGKARPDKGRNVPAKAVAKSVSPVTASKAEPLVKAKQQGLLPPGPNAAAGPATPGPTKPDEDFVEVQLQCRCAGLYLWNDEVELELKWTRIDVQDCYEPSQQPEPYPDPASCLEVTLAYKCKGDSEQRLLPLTIRLSSPQQRCTLYHAMLFNKYRGPFYSIDQGERDLQRGLYSDVKDAYAKICKHVARRLARVSSASPPTCGP